MKTVLGVLKKGRGKTILPLVDKYLIGRNRPVESDEWVHPSSIGKISDMCDRAVFFDRFAPKEKTPSELLVRDHAPETHRIFDVGDAAHIRWQSYLIESGMTDPRKGRGWEVPVFHEKYGLLGTADAIAYPQAKNEVLLMRLPSGHGGSLPLITAQGFEWSGNWMAAGKPVLIEVKSMRHAQWQFLMAPLAHHLVQATCYAAVLNIPEIFFIYESKETQRVKEFRADLKLWPELKKHLANIQESKNKKKLPQRICSSIICSRAQRCVWVDLCFETKTYNGLVNIK